LLMSHFCVSQEPLARLPATRLETALLADVLGAEGAELAPRPYFDVEEAAAAARAGLGAATTRRLPPRVRARGHASPRRLRLTNVAFCRPSLRSRCHREPPSMVSPFCQP
jgi:hypothetical protein